MQINPVEQFRDAIRAVGLVPPDSIEVNGKLHRFSSNGKKTDDAGWYLLHGDGIPAGQFGDWRSGITQSWRADIGRPLTPDEEAAHRVRVEAIRREREVEDARSRAEAKAKAAAIWQKGEPAPSEHPYLIRKGIESYGVRQYNEALLIPIQADGEICSLQFIGPDGDKRFLTGGRVKGCYFCIGDPKSAAALCIVEGFATGATIHGATGYPVAVAFNAGNMGVVAKAMRDKFPDLPLILCADDDANTEGNPGKSKAMEAAQAVGGLLALPDFGDDRPDGMTDFNDLYLYAGAAAVRNAVKNATLPGNAITSVGAAESDWRSPQPLTSAIQRERYPIEALPATIRAAVEEVAAFVQAPVSLVATTALAALSLAVQAHVDVQRTENLTGPTGLFLLTIAESGERKSTCDSFFSRPIRDYQARQAEAAKPIMADYHAALDAWEAKQAGIKEQIRNHAKAGKATAELESALRDLVHQKPEAPRVPRLLYSDVTPEALAMNLARHWPSGGVMSSEAGSVFGSHGMSGDSIMRNLAMLNQLWDGAGLSIDRKSSESFTVKGARLTVALQVQEPTLRSFFEKSGTLARGTGFLARFLIAWPESTQGTRFFTEPPEQWPALTLFHGRIGQILETAVPIGDDGALLPILMTLSPVAKALWIEYYDVVEAAMAQGGEYREVSDVAAKSADNAARLAALFQMFEHGLGRIVDGEAMSRAIAITAWHLDEARNFFGKVTVGPERTDAMRLETWLLAYCHDHAATEVCKNHVRQHGPGPLRNGHRLDAAIEELSSLNRVKLVKVGRGNRILINPALLEDLA